MVLVLAPLPRTAASLDIYSLAVMSSEHARTMGRGQGGHHTVDVSGHTPQ